MMVLPPPDVGTFTGAHGTELFTQCWLPSLGDAGEARAAVGMVHGISEHSGRYPAIVNGLTSAGFAVCGYDHRGHGRSPGKPGHINSWSEYREDLRAFVESLQRRFSGLPLFLYAHSLGALIATEYVLHYPDGLAGMIVSGIPLKPKGVASPPLVLLARSLSRVAPRFSIKLGVNGKGVSRDPEVIRAYNDDPLVHHVATARWGTETLDAIDRVRSHLGDIWLPMLILHGGADPVNSVEGSLELLEKVGSGDKEIRIYPGGLHEPHNDLERDEVVMDVTDWLNRHLASVKRD
jgi:alpha-beta hydrolase superfamily lysophospholipase